MKKYLALKASAGSGKTYALANRYVSLLLLDIEPNKILTLTFTNKATNEMKVRILKNIELLGTDEAMLEALSAQTNMSKKDILLKKRDILEKMSNNELSIYTIDKFLNKILREFGGYIKISDNFTIQNENSTSLISNFLHSLDATQLYLFVKLMLDFNQSIDKIIDIYKILEAKNDSITHKANDDDDLKIAQSKVMQHAFAIKKEILEKKHTNSCLKALDFSNTNELFDKGKTWLLKEELSEFSFFKADAVENLGEEFEHLKQSIKEYLDIKQNIMLRQVYMGFENFANFKKKYNFDNNSLDFNDILNNVLELLSNYIHKDFLYFRLDAKFEHILMDEFQDTSILQYKILKPLIDEIFSGNEDVFKTFFYVGDQKQAIYRFRGGKKELFDFVANQYKENLSTEVLSVNFRSSKNIVNFVNDVFLKIENFEYHEQQANSTTEGFVKIDLFEEADELYDKIISQIKELLSKGHSASKIAILTFKNKDVLDIAKYIEQKLPNVEVSTQSKLKLINQKCVKAVINGLKYLYFKEDIYRYNFNYILGLEADNEIDISLNLQKTPLKTLIVRFAKHYMILDDNTLKLIELCSDKFTSTIQFLYEIDSQEAEINIANNNGIQILTIHKSKGLEFDTVMIMDKTTIRNRPDITPFVFSYDEFELSKIYLKNKLKESFDKNYYDAIQKEKTLSQEDNINTIYVALTRAQNNLYLFKNGKKSIFDIASYLCKDMTIGQEAKISSVKVKSKTKQIIDYVPVVVGLQNKTNSNEKKIKVIPKYYGIATHYCLEILQNFDAKYIDEAMKKTIKKFDYILNSTHFSDIKASVCMLVENNEFQDIVANGKFFKEKELIFDGERKVIDILIQKNDDTYIIVDYKTSLQEHIQNTKQVQTYVQAVKDITNSQDVCGYIVKLNKNECIVTKV